MLLDMQYRMHPAIAEFPSAQFYAGRLRTGIAAAERPLPQGGVLRPLALILKPLQCSPLSLEASVPAAMHHSTRGAKVLHARFSQHVRAGPALLSRC